MLKATVGLHARHCSLLILTNILGCVCRAPLLKVLAKDMLYPAPEFSEGLFESAGARLQFLQLVTSELGPAYQLWEDFWRGLEACTELAALHLIFTVNPEQGVAQQVISKS